MILLVYYPRNFGKKWIHLSGSFCQSASEKYQNVEKYWFVIQTSDIFGLGINYRIEWYNILPLNMRFSSGPK